MNNSSPSRLTRTMFNKTSDFIIEQSSNIEGISMDILEEEVKKAKLLSLYALMLRRLELNKCIEVDHKNRRVIAKRILLKSEIFTNYEILKAIFGEKAKKKMD